jgi:two-component system, response regulator PdtaR
MALFRRQKRVIHRLMVVEDDPLIAFDNEHAFETAGYTVVATVDRGDRALPFLDPAVIDVVVLDVGLAGDISGLEVAHRANAIGVPVLFVTGQCPEPARTLAHGCLAKPYLSTHLVAALGAVDALLRGDVPGHLPAGLTLFREPVAR